MKKKFIGIGIICAMAIAAVFTVNLNKNEDKVSDMLLVNIEALAQGEIPATCTFTIVKKNQEKNELICKGTGGSLCCVMN